MEIRICHCEPFCESCGARTWQSVNPLGARLLRDEKTNQGHPKTRQRFPSCTSDSNFHLGKGGFRIQWDTLRLLAAVPLLQSTPVVPREEGIQASTAATSRGIPTR